MAKFRLERQNAKIMGVCGGMANMLNWDPTLVRIGWVVGVIAGAGLLIPVYLVAGLIAD